MRKQGRRHRRYRRVFLESRAQGPWPCFVCHELIVKIGQGRWDGNIHHLDEDVTNDVPENLDIAHTVCHLRLHPPTIEARASISEKLTGRPSPTRGMTFDDETNRRKSQPGELNPFYGKRHTTAALQKMRHPRQRKICIDCGVEYAINWLHRHKVEGKCVS